MTVIFAEDKFRERTVKKLIDELENLYGSAGKIWMEFAELAQTNLSEAIKQLPRFLDRMRNDVNPGGRAMEALAGGPNPDWIVPLFNVIGEIYPDLAEDVRKEFLQHCLSYFDLLNYTYSQDHVEKLQEPFLIADILANRVLYWPGVGTARARLKKLGSIDAMAKEPSERIGTPWICLAIIWNSNEITLPLRRWFYMRHPEIVERTLQIAAVLVVTGAEKAARAHGIDLQSYLATRLAKFFEPNLHDRIRKRMEEKTWIVLP